MRLGSIIDACSLVAVFTLLLNKLVIHELGVCKGDRLVRGMTRLTGVLRSALGLPALPKPRGVVVSGALADPGQVAVAFGAS